MVCPVPAINMQKIEQYNKTRDYLNAITWGQLYNGQPIRINHFVCLIFLLKKLGEKKRKENTHLPGKKRATVARPNLHMSKPVLMSY